MATLSSMNYRTYNKPFWFLHIEGFPQVWFTEIPDNWTAPSGMEYLPGLMILPQSGVDLSHDIDPMSGVEDSSTLSIKVCGDTFLELATGTARSDDGFDGACLVTNNVVAGTDVNITAAKPIFNAPDSDGIFYLGNQTITYSTKSGSVFSGINRGRFHSLSDTDLTETTFKPSVEWDENLDTAPLITLTPRTMLGRVATLYRSYFLDEPDGYALEKGEQNIRFRGFITAYGDSDDHLGIEVSIESIISLLDRNVYFPAEADITGYDVPEWTTTVNGSQKANVIAGSTDVFITVQELLFNATVSSYQTYRPPVKISLGTAADLANIDDLISAINTSFATELGAGNLLSSWWIKRYKGKIMIGYDVVGVDTIGTTPLPKGSTDAVGFGIWGKIYIDNIVQLLGFAEEDAIGKWENILPHSHIYSAYPYQEYERYLSDFARWTNPTYYASYILDSNLYRPIVWISKNAPAKFCFIIGEGSRVPSDNADVAGFVDFPPDNSPFLVCLPSAPDAVIFQAAAIDSGGITLPYPSYDVSYPIGRQGTVAKETYSVSETSSEEHVVRQAWMPTGGHETQFSFGIYTWEYGLEHLFLQILTSTGAGKSVKYNSDWDILPKEWGGGIPEAYINTESFEKLRDIYGDAALKRGYIFTENFNLKDFIESEALTLGFMVTVVEGKITVIARTEPTINNSVDVDNSTRIANGQVLWQSSPEGITNAITIKMDFDIGEEDFRRIHQYLNLASQTDTGNVQSVEIENRGIRSKNWLASTETINEIDMILQDRLSDWSTESYVYECEINRSLDMLIIGDPVLVTDDMVPNPLTGTRGITNHPGTVEAISFDDSTGMGTLRVRLRYGSLFQLVVPNLVGISPEVAGSGLWNTATVAAATGVPPGAEGVTFTIDKTVYQKNTNINSPEEGDLVQIVTPATGQVDNRVVVGYDEQTGDITLDAPIGQGEDERVLTTQDFERTSVLSINTELQTTYVALDDGLLLTNLGFIFS